MEIRIAVCDDEVAIQEQIKQYIKKYFSQTKDTATIQCFNSGEALLKTYNNQFDLLVLDIQMGQLNGIETAKRVRKQDDRVCIVFVTALEEYAKAGYEVKAFRYFTKPLSWQQCRLEIEKIVNEIKQNTNVYICVKNNEGVFRINIRDIMCVEVYGRKCKIKLKDRVIENNETMKKMEQAINDPTFVRSHQSYLVNLAYVLSLENNREVHLLNGDIALLSKGKRKQFMDELTNYLGSKL